MMKKKPAELLIFIYFLVIGLTLFLSVPIVSAQSCGKAPNHSIKFEGTVVRELYSLDEEYYPRLAIDVRVDRELEDPFNILEVGSVVTIRIGLFCDPAAHIDIVNKGDKVEVYGRYDCELDSIIVFCSPSYIKKVVEICEVDVWTDKGGKGCNLDDGKYRLFERFYLYFSSNVPACGPCIKFVGPYGEVNLGCATLCMKPGVVYNVGPIYFDEKRDVGEWTIVIEASSNDGRRISDSMRMWVLPGEGATVTTFTTVTTTYLTMTEYTTIGGSTVTRFVTASVFTTSTETSTVVKWTTITITDDVYTKTYCVTVTRTVTNTTTQTTTTTTTILKGVSAGIVLSGAAAGLLRKVRRRVMR